MIVRKNRENKKEKDKDKERARHVPRAPLWGPSKKPLKLTNKNSGSFECVFGVNDEGFRTFDAKKNDRVIVERYDSFSPEGKAYHEGIIVNIHDDGTVEWFDEVREQWWLFNWQDDDIPLVIKKKPVPFKESRTNKKEVDENYDK